MGNIDSQSSASHHTLKIPVHLFISFYLLIQIWEGIWFRDARLLFTTKLFICECIYIYTHIYTHMYLLGAE